MYHMHTISKESGWLIALGGNFETGRACFASSGVSRSIDPKASEARARISRHVSNWSVTGLNCYEGRESERLHERAIRWRWLDNYMEMAALEKTGGQKPR